MDMNIFMPLTYLKMFHSIFGDAFWVFIILSSAKLSMNMHAEHNCHIVDERRCCCCWRCLAVAALLAQRSTYWIFSCDGFSVVAHG